MSRNFSSINSPRWLVRSRKNEGAATRLFCFHPAGGSAALYFPWLEKGLPGMEIIALQLPGRSFHAPEETTNVHELIAELTCRIEALSDKPYAFFGHSFGAILAYEVARRLNPGPRHLFVSACAAPWLFAQNHLSFKEGEEDVVLATLVEMGNLPTALALDPQARKQILEVFRSDCRLMDSYCFEKTPALRCPITAFGGKNDAHVTEEALRAWSARTNGEFRYRMFPGGHFYLLQEWKNLEQEIAV